MGKPILFTDISEKAYNKLSDKRKKKNYIVKKEDGSKSVLFEGQEFGGGSGDNNEFIVNCRVSERDVTQYINSDVTGREVVNALKDNKELKIIGIGEDSHYIYYFTVLRVTFDDNHLFLTVCGYDSKNNPTPVTSQCSLSNLENSLKFTK